MNLIEANYQINMNSEHSVSSNDLFKSHLNAKSFNMSLTQLCKAQRFCFSGCCKGDAREW